MRKTFFLLFISCLFSSCAVSTKIKDDNVKLTFLDEMVIAPDLDFQGTILGGLSGIDYKNGSYYLVSDQSSNPRIYKAKIAIENTKIKKIEIEELITISKSEGFKNNFLDLESIRFDELRDEFIVVSEGLIDDAEDPGIFRINKKGQITEKFEIPEYFRATNDQKPRSNGVFEGLSESYDQQGYWVATELPLIKDASKPKIFPSRSHVRFTKFDKNTGQAMRQFTYQLDGIAKLPINYFAVNGVTEIIEYKENKFLVLERAYSAGYGSHGNTVKIFEVDASLATNTLEMAILKNEKYTKAGKKLLFNFKSVKEKLTDEIVDNIEGMTLGPVLENGEQSLILVSDNNFNSFAKQINQFILMQINFQE